LQDGHAHGGARRLRWDARKQACTHASRSSAPGRCRQRRYCVTRDATLAHLGSPSSVRPPQHVGLGRYCELFRRLEIGRPLCELCNDNREVWEELWREPQGLGLVATEDRDKLVNEMTAILEYCAKARAEEKVEAELAAKYLGKGADTVQLPGAREDGRVGLWLEKKSPARGKGWQPRWFVFCPHTAQVHYFEEPEDEDLENRENKRWLSLALVTRITSNNFESGHFEFHSATKVMELRVPNKSREQLGVIEELLAGLKALGVFAKDNSGTIEAADTVAYKDPEAEAARKDKAALEAATKAAKITASPAYLATLGMSFSGLSEGTWLEVVERTEVSAPLPLSRTVGHVEKRQTLRALEVRTTDQGGFTKVRFDNGKVKGWVDVIAWDCKLLLEMMDEEKELAARRTFDSSPEESQGAAAAAGDDSHVGWYRAVQKAVVRCGYDAESPRLDDLPIGAEIEAVESRVNPLSKTPRVRFLTERPGTPNSPAVSLSCWVSTKNGKGAEILEKRPGPSIALPGERRGAAYLDRTVGLWLEKKSPARGKGWQRRWFVFDRDGTVNYYSSQAEEQTDQGGKRKQMFSLRDCARITSPNRENGVFELQLETKKPYAGITKTETKTMTLRVEEKTFEGEGPMPRVQALQKVEELFGFICTNGGMKAGNDGSIVDAAGAAAAGKGGPEEAVPPAAAGGVQEGVPSSSSSEQEREQAEGVAAVRAWLEGKNYPLHALSLVEQSFRGSGVPGREWLPTLESWQR
jgi:hypothetical protein